VCSNKLIYLSSFFFPFFSKRADASLSKGVAGVQQLLIGSSDTLPFVFKSLSNCSGLHMSKLFITGAIPKRYNLLSKGARKTA